MVFGRKRKVANQSIDGDPLDRYSGNMAGENIDALKEQLLKALHTFAYISPVKSLDPLRQGDVLVSTSGNMRLVLNLERKKSNSVATFLTYRHEKGIKIESALLKRIDHHRLEAVVVRRAANPLGQFEDVAKCIGKESDIFFNVSVLLRLGMLGQAVDKKLKSESPSPDANQIMFYISQASGKIEGVEGKPAGKPVIPVTMLLNRTFLPTAEYVLRMKLPEPLNDIVKRNIVAASVFANSIQNAKNLANLVRRIEGHPPFPE